MGPVLAFWFTAVVVGCAALPIAFALMRRLPDAGAGLAMPLGLVLCGYAYFVLRIAGVIEQGRGGYLLTLLLLALAGAAVAGRDRRFASTLRRTWRGIALAVGVFTLAFFLFVAYRSYVPEINGTEQPMDFMYLNATLESPDYPPHDPWLAGERASYYYFGYLQVGVLTSVAGVGPATGYNLGLAYTFGAAAAGAASLAAGLARLMFGSRARGWVFAAGAAAGLMLLGLGSFSAVFEWSAAHGHYNRTLFETFGVEWLIPCRPGETASCFQGLVQGRTHAWYPTEFWFWWRGSRIIPNTITEFPFFSFLLGDMHPHVMSIPLVLLSMGLSAASWRGRRLLRAADHLRRPALLLVLAVVFGGLAFENAWDVLTFTGLLSAAVIARNLRCAGVRRALGHAAGYLFPVYALAVVLYTPWYLTFTSQASGFYPYTGAGTRPAHAFLQFGPLLLAALSFLAWTVRRRDFPAFARAASFTLWVPLVPMFAWTALAAKQGHYGLGIDSRGEGGWVTLAAYGTATWLLATAFVLAAARRLAIAPAIGFAAVGALLLYGAELFFIRDVFFGSVPRLNTVFKLTYQAWILLSVAGAVAVVGAARAAWARRSPAGWVAVPIGLVLVAGMSYALTSAANRTELFGRDSPPGSVKHTDIDGLAFLARSDPAEYALQQWVRTNVPAGAVILEASGRSWRRDEQGNASVANASVDYTDAARISGRTGRQAPIGWFFHEVQWRGEGQDNQQLLLTRQNLVDQAYVTGDPRASLEAIRQLGVEYVVVGRIEFARYPGDLMPRFEDFLDVVYERDGLRVYRVPTYEVMATS